MWEVTGRMLCRLTFTRNSKLRIIILDNLNKFENSQKILMLPSKIDSPTRGCYRFSIYIPRWKINGGMHNTAYWPTRRLAYSVKQIWNRMCTRIVAMATIAIVGKSVLTPRSTSFVNSRSTGGLAVWSRFVFKTR